jgi:hypothetical protein
MRAMQVSELYGSSPVPQAFKLRSAKAAGVQSAIRVLVLSPFILLAFVLPLLFAYHWVAGFAGPDE